MTEQTEPQAPVIPGRWVRMGGVAVDSASIAIVDPMMEDESSLRRPITAKLYDDTSSGVRLMAGFGDGGYDVWGWVIDAGGGDERVAQVVVTLITAVDLQEWKDCFR